MKCESETKMTESRVHVQSVLNMIEAVSKVFFLSPLNSAAKSKQPVSYKNLTFWNVWTLVGFFGYMNCHLIYVSQNDNSGRHLKLVTVFIDMYNKYCGLLLSFTLVVVGYFQQANIANINLLFGEIEDEFARGMKIKIKNLKALR